MPITELKCIEILMRHLAQNTDLEKEAETEFSEIESFDSVKTNLFNMVSIYNLIDHFTETPSFSLETFLHTGVIPGLYEEKTFTPSVDIPYLRDYKSFYKNLIEALKEENYIFDESNNVFVSSLKIETTLPQIWLYHLSEAVRRTKYERVYFYNKNKENNIVDSNALIDYLRHTKTFVVELTSGDPTVDFDLEFIAAQARTNSGLRNEKEVKVESIIEKFEASLPSNVTSKISRYRLSDALWLVNKAEQLGNAFYTESLDVQQKYINKWLLEFINSNDFNKNESQKFILLANSKSGYENHTSSIDKKEAIAGLFTLYLRLLKSVQPDFTCVSLTDFKIEEYSSENLQENILLLRHAIKHINKEDEKRSELGKTIQTILKEISEIDSASPEIDVKREEYYRLLEQYRSMETIAQKNNERRNVIQKAVQEEQKTSIESIAFDNDRIIDMIYKATQSGRIYFKHGTNQLILELYNDELGKVIFKASISMEKLITFIENLNFSIEEHMVPLKVG